MIQEFGAMQQIAFPRAQEPFAEHTDALRRNLLRPVLIVVVIAICILGGCLPVCADVAEEFQRLNDQCWALLQAGKYAKAEELAIQVKRLAESRFAKQPLAQAFALNTLAAVYLHQEKFEKAEPLFMHALEQIQLALGPDHADTATALNNLADVYFQQGNYTNAEPLQQRALAIREKKLGPEHPHVALSLASLGDLYYEQGKYDKAEPLQKRCLAIRERNLGPAHPDTARSLIALAKLHEAQGKSAEAEVMYVRGLAILENSLGAEHPDVAQCMEDLAIFYHDQGRYAQAELLHRRALAITEKTIGSDSSTVALIVSNLGGTYLRQGRYREAIPLVQRALDIWVKLQGKFDSRVAGGLLNMASMERMRGDLAAAEVKLKWALNTYERISGDEDPHVASALHGLGLIFAQQGNYREAESLHKKALLIKENAYGCDSSEVVGSLDCLASLYLLQDRCAEAREVLDRALDILVRSTKDPHWLIRCRFRRAVVIWEMKRPQEAMADLELALQSMELLRTQASQEEFVRAQFWADNSPVYERMAQWHAELGNPSESLRVVERSRARSFVEQIEAQGVNLFAGLQREEADRLRCAEIEALSLTSGLQKQLKILQQRRDLSENERNKQRSSLESQLRKSQGDYLSARTKSRNASPAFGLALRQGSEAVPVSEIQKWAARENALVLEYVIGVEASLVLVIAAAEPVRVIPLVVGDSQAEALGIDSGPLTDARMRQALTNEQHTGILDRVRTMTSASVTDRGIEALRLLGELLIPEQDRGALFSGRYRRLVVLPDGPMAGLPFEMLAVRSSQETKYLLDVAPPICYGPSATALLNLASREGSPPPRGHVSILTVGDCRYGAPSPVSEVSVLLQLAPPARYSRVGGQLTPLPHSKWETAWVADVFRKSGNSVQCLAGPEATEETVRANAADHAILHFACHGLADAEYGNLFGALALTPGPGSDDPTNDGFLTLAEIYSLSLTGCELTILSACETNVGPTQRGEGIWALSRGFLVAGSRRVVASNWLVDDEGSARLVSYFCSILAKDQAEGRTPDYAAALQKAKQWLRSQEKWQSPYDWAPFVLIGPY